VAKYSSEITINVAPERVFEYVADMTRHGEWGDHGLQVTRTSAGDGVGATYSSMAKSFGTQKETQVVVQHEPPRRFAFDATGSLGIAHHVFEIEPSGAGAHVVKSMELTKPSFLGKLFTPMIGRQQRPGLQQDLARIKEKLEGGA
jgi:uncharacterized protein YndB with AHSA1/START domain